MSVRVVKDYFLDRVRFLVCWILDCTILWIRLTKLKVISRWKTTYWLQIKLINNNKKKKKRTVYNNPSTLEDKPVQDQSAYIQASFLATGKNAQGYSFTFKNTWSISLNDEASPRGKTRSRRKCWCVWLRYWICVGWHHVGHLDRRVRSCWIG